jgi:hypothetical protein
MRSLILKIILGGIMLELGDSVSFTGVAVDALDTWYGEAVSSEAGAGASSMFGS